jgi:predicted ester cyclase
VIGGWLSEQNKLIARRFLAAFAAGDTATLTQLVSENIVDHSAPPVARPGRSGVLDAVAMFREGFPDMQISADRIVAEGESVAVHGRMKGTNTGPMGRPPTGKPADVGYMDMYRIANGQIMEVWHVEDIAACSSNWGWRRPRLGWQPRIRLPL